MYFGGILDGPSSIILLSDLFLHTQKNLIGKKSNIFGSRFEHMDFVTFSATTSLSLSFLVRTEHKIQKLELAVHGPSFSRH